ncbi:MAG: class I SAM-dependent methyltransferase [Proteobacteria bacterium]|nr:class I SAM-dependent methyltransferase [Pseudomonadota bacterium]
MTEDVNTIYKVKLFVLKRVGNFKVLRVLDDLYHIIGLPLGFLTYLFHRLIGRPYFGIWLASAQGHPGRFPYMKKTVEHLAKTSDPEVIRNLKILEIGAYAGGSALVWGRALKNNGATNGKLISVDPWDSYIDLTGNHRIVFRVMNRNLGNGNVLRLFVQNLKAAGVSDVCHQFRGRSEDILPMLNSKFDIIYIDASHHVDAVTKDLELSLPLLKDGGVICGAGLERQLEDLDPEFVKAHFHTDLFIDPKTGQTFHPGITYAVGNCFGRRISHYGGYWVVRKNGEKFEDVVLS